MPVLWDKKKETIVNNESADIIRMLYSAFDAFVPEHLREVNKPGGGLYPDRLRSEIDAMNVWVYDTVNNGVYKTGFASTQEAYDANIYPLFKSLDRLEEHLGHKDHQPYLFGAHITEADIRLYVTLIRFDAAYYTIFKCNLKMVRHDYPRLHAWLRRLYWDEGTETNGGAFRETTWFNHVSGSAIFFLWSVRVRRLTFEFGQIDQGRVCVGREGQDRTCGAFAEYPSFRRERVMSLQNI